MLGVTRGMRDHRAGWGARAKKFTSSWARAKRNRALGVPARETRQLALALGVAGDDDDESEDDDDEPLDVPLPDVPLPDVAFPSPAAFPSLVLLLSVPSVLAGVLALLLSSEPLLEPAPGLP